MMWTEKQINNLQKRQNCENLHPYTCHHNDCPNPLDNELRKLIPTVNGWICHCGKYTQNWAHDFDLDGSFPEFNIKDLFPK